MLRKISSLFGQRKRRADCNCYCPGLWSVLLIALFLELLWEKMSVEGDSDRRILVDTNCFWGTDSAAEE